MKTKFYFQFQTILFGFILLFASFKSNGQALICGNTYPINGTNTPPTSFSTIANAAAYAVTNGITGSGTVTFQLQTGYTSASEPATGIYLDSVPGANASRGILIKPASGFSATISGSDTARGRINFRNCSYYTIDGRQAGTGTASMTITNTYAVATDSSSAVRFTNGANNNVIKYCILQSSAKSVTNSGVVYFGVGNTYSGNSFNTVEYCNIDGASSSHNGICSFGSSASTAVENTSDTIRNNNIYDYYNNAGASGNAGIRIQTGSNAWYISGNSIYQTTTRAYTGNNLHYGILIGEGSYFQTDYYTITNNSIGGSAASALGMMNITNSTGVCGHAGIYMYLGNGSTISNNVIKNISVSYGTASGSYSNAGIYSFLKYSGTVNIINNTIDTTQFTNTLGLVTYSGIQLDNKMDTTYAKNISPVFNVTGNAVKNITLNTTGVLNTVLYGMKMATTTVTNQGSGYFCNLTVNANTNTIDGLKSNGIGTGSYCYGVLANATNTGTSIHLMKIYPTITNNTIRNIYSNGTIASNSSPNAGGIIFTNTTTGGGVYTDTVRIRSNTIYNIYGQNTSDLNISVGGIFVNRGRTDITKNKIYNLYNAAYASVNTPNVYGINIYSLEANSSVDNNFISIGDTATTNQAAFGIVNALSASYALNVYNNTILISGSSTNKNSAAILRGDPSTFAGMSTAINLNNNLLVNRRTSSVSNVAIAMPGTAAFLSDYNTLLTNSASSVGYYNASNYGYTNWDSVTGTDNYSYFGVVNATTNFAVNPPTISLSDLFTNVNYSSAANLLINNANTTCWMLFGKGIAIPSYGLDFLSQARSTTLGVPVCIGANEFSTTTTPPNNFNMGNYATNDSITAFFGGRKVLRIVWGTLALPFTSAYYSGKTNSTYISGKNVSASYWAITPTGGSTITYSVKIFYGPHEKGTIVNSNTSTRLAYYSGATWNLFSSSYADITQYPQVATIVGSTRQLNSITAFSLTDNVNSLPINLIEFIGTKSNEDVLLNWATASELNNKYFAVERSFDGSNFIEIGKVKGAMNSNVSNSYSFTDKEVQLLNTKIVYYRLKQVDANGEFGYSKTVNVKYDVTTNHTVIVAPNPFNDKVGISFSDKPSTIHITDVCGKVIREFSTVNLIENSLIIDLTNFEQGVYFVNLIYQDGQQTQKIIKAN